MKYLGGTGLKKIRGGEDFMLTILANQYKIYFSRIFFSPAVHNCFQIIQIHSFSKKLLILSLIDTIFILVDTCVFSLPHVTYYVKFML